MDTNIKSIFEWPSLFLVLIVSLGSVSVGQKLRGTKCAGEGKPRIWITSGTESLKHSFNP